MNKKNAVTQGVGKHLGMACAEPLNSESDREFRHRVAMWALSRMEPVWAVMALYNARYDAGHGKLYDYNDEDYAVDCDHAWLYGPRPAVLRDYTLDDAYRYHGEDDDLPLPPDDPLMIVEV